MPLRDYICSYCGHEFEQIVYAQDPDEYETAECRCGSRAKLLPALIGGYTGSTGSGSTRPKHSTAMPKKKVFTGYDEFEVPEKEEE